MKSIGGRCPNRSRKPSRREQTQGVLPNSLSKIFFFLEITHLNEIRAGSYLNGPVSDATTRASCHGAVPIVQQKSVAGLP